MKKLLTHPITRGTRTVLRRIVITCAVILAVALVTTLTVDLGPSLKVQAERAGSNYIERPMHIGRLGIRIFAGKFVVEDLVIEGLTPESRPFLTARRIDVSMAWSTLFHREVMLDAIEMVDWRMYIETLPDGRHNFPRFTRDRPPGRRSWTTTVAYVRAYRGETTYEDHGTPWSTVARNLDVIVAHPTDQYRGQANFSDGTVQIQRYEPMRADMQSNFRIVDGKVVLDKIELQTTGAVSHLTGVVDLGHWPEQTYQIRSHYDFPTMRRLFFAHDTFELSGEGDFTGSFHLFKEVVNGRSRTGRDLHGTFRSALFGVNTFRFPNLSGNVKWVPESLEVSNGAASFFDGRAGFSYRMAPLDNPGVKATYTFNAQYADVDLVALSNFMKLPGLRLTGRASGSNELAWPSGEFGRRHGRGELRVQAPPGTTLMTRDGLQAAAPVVSDAPAGDEAAAGRLVRRSVEQLPPVTFGGEFAYAFDPEAITVGPSRMATPATYVEFEGRTAYGQRSQIPFHVTSSDWQESDELLSRIMTAFGAPTDTLPIGGAGTFDGRMDGDFRRPRIEGLFAGQRMRAFDVEWGEASGTAVIENNYADVRNVVVRSGDSTITTTGRFSLGFPRKDSGDEIDAIVRVEKRPIRDLRHAFALDEYDVTGLFDGEFHVYGKYLQPLGFGAMSIADGAAYGEPFEQATAAVRLEGDGVRLDNLRVTKGGGTGSGAAYVGLNGTYSFNFDGRGIPVEKLAMVSSANVPLSGLIDFTAGGSGTFDAPRYDVRGTVRDFFIADEGIGTVVGTIGINEKTLAIRVEAASPRLAISGAGQVDLTGAKRADILFSVADTSLDPYIRAFQPDLSPYTTAVASGTVRVNGSLANIDELLVETQVDKLDIRFFDYRIANANPIQVTLDRRSIRLPDARLVGDGTQLNVSGVVNLHDERIAMSATGNANLGILQALMPNVRSSGQAVVEATFDGPMRDPLVTGNVTIADGRIRHFDLPHAIDNIAGVVRFDSRAVQFDEITARIGGGPVQFSGGVAIQNYRPGRIDLVMSGQNMRLRFPEGMTSLVDANLTLQGSLDSATLGGNVFVRNAVYRGNFDPNGAGSLSFGTGATPTAVNTTAPIQPTVPLRYDISISVPSSLRVENRAIRLEASADLQLRGTFDRPVLIGRAELVRGDVTFEGRRYVVTRGTIDFNNPTRIDPFFDVETETRVRVPDQTYRVTVRAVGTFARFTPEFSSDPPLPEIEVLGLLFSDVSPGRDVELRQYAAVTPQEQLLRERATRALTGTLSANVGRVVEQTIGVDTFQLTPSLIDPNAQSARLDPAARLTIGKRLSDRAYLTYSRSLSSTTRDQIILLEYDQTDRFSWILSRNEDRTYALDVRMRHVF